MKLLTFNIRHGGGTRCDGICAAIEAHQPDIVVLTEFRQGSSGTRIRDTLRAGGWRHQECSNPPEKTNGVLVAASADFAPCARPRNVPLGSWRWLECQFETFLLVATYFPLGEPKLPYWDWFLAQASSRVNRPSILIGDFNTGKHLIDEAGRTFVGSEYMERLENVGYVDAWRDVHPDTREFTWYSAAKNGFRLDYAFLSPEMRKRLRSATHSHSEREQRISDHSALIVEFDGATGFLK